MASPVPASRLLLVSKAREVYLPTGLAALDEIISGLPRGAVTEFTGPRSSGKASLVAAVLAEATGSGESCAVVDAAGGFDPVSAGRGGVVLENLVWVRCSGNAGRAFRAVDLLLHGGGFGVVVLDLAEIAPRVLNHVPLSYWYRFRRAVQGTQTVFVVVSDRAQTRSTSSCWLEMTGGKADWAGSRIWALLRGVRTLVYVRKPGPPRPVRLETRELSLCG